MIFLSYDFVWFAAFFYLLYYLLPIRTLRLAVIVAGSVTFLWQFGGWSGVVIVGILATITFCAGRSGNPRAIVAAIIACVASLAFYKYTFFLADKLVGAFAPGLGNSLHAAFGTVVPAIVPLGMSFFTFEFVHYLVELRRGGRPVSGLLDFVAFAFYWPTMVAGPIKRYQQFLPSLHTGLAGPSATDAMAGLSRVAVGLAKKWAADNLTAWIDFHDGRFEQLPLEARWLLLAALAFRILLDFSGYSDMAIGFARMMGITVPENFNWPYLARNPIEFWQRWHISLSSWIRDYIYIPLGGNRMGLERRILNALLAMGLCGLWHGASWNFVLWGLYHGAGLSVASLFGNWRTGREGAQAAQDLFGQGGIRMHNSTMLQTITDSLSWAATMVFVAFGWLLFFYPPDRAWVMARLLLSPGAP